MSPVKGSSGDRNIYEGLRAFGTPNPSLSNVAHEGLFWCRPGGLYGMANWATESRPTDDGYLGTVLRTILGGLKPDLMKFKTLLSLGVEYSLQKCFELHTEGSVTELSAAPRYLFTENWQPPATGYHNPDQAGYICLYLCIINVNIEIS